MAPAAARTTWSSTATRASRARSRTTCSSSATRTRSSRARSSPPTRRSATQAFIYVRGEFALGLERMQAALNEAYAHGAVGRDIFGSGFSVDVVVHPGAGAYICGEETALLESLEGKRGFPRDQAAVIFPAAIGALQQADRRQQRRDDVQPPVDRDQRRRRLRRPGRRPLHRHPDLLAVGPREAAGQLRGRDGQDHLPRPHLRPRARRRHPRRQRAEGVHPRRRVGAVVRPRAARHAARPGRGRRPKACPAAARCSARARSSSWTTRPAWCGPRGASPGSSHRESCGQCTPCREGSGWLEKIMRRIESGAGPRGGPRPAARRVRQHRARASSWPTAKTTICVLGPSIPIVDHARPSGCSATSSSSTSRTAAVRMADATRSSRRTETVTITVDGRDGRGRARAR